MANSLYSDRINTYVRMVEVDSALDINPTQNLIVELVELGIRNRLCFKELKMFNNFGKFCYEHPFFTLDANRRKLQELIDSNLEAFLEEYRSAKNNVIRYKTLLAKSPEDKQHKFNEIISKHENSITTIINLLSDHVASIQTTVTPNI